MDAIYYYVRCNTGEKQYELKWTKNVVNSLNRYRDINIFEDDDYATVEEHNITWMLPKSMFTKYLR